MSVPISTQVSTQAASHAAARYALPQNRVSSMDALLRRTLDVTVSSAALLLLMPILAIIALLIRLDSAGSVLFIQRRVGKNGQEFPVFKFRSMYIDAEKRLDTLLGANERTGPVFKMRQDPRVTRVGRVLRKFSLDELPQLLNVLRGEMSLVGPRPALPREVALYTPEQRLRLSVTPGLTGLWQVSGRANLSFEKSMELDLEYIHRQSFTFNLVLLARTVPAVVTGHGAY
jgi:lipopolysaccharide/colanic/teichoic acid biosynthesis glycosyltransferase